MEVTWRTKENGPYIGYGLGIELWLGDSFLAGTKTWSLIGGQKGD